MNNSLPQARVVTITRRGADRIRAGHVWVYRSDVVEAEGVQPGAAVLVQEVGDPRARKAADNSVRAARPLADKDVRPTRTRELRPLGTAFYSSASEIAIRMISLKPVHEIEQLLRERIPAAIAYRGRFVQNTNAYRVIFSEGDFLPGLIVDKYNDILSLQVLTQAWDPEPIRKIFLSELQAALQPRAIVERVDPRVRKLEQLPEKESGIVWQSLNLTNDVIPNPDPDRGEEPAVPGREAGSSSFGSAPLPGMTSLEGIDPRQTPIAPQVRTEFHMNGVRFSYDALAGQKTGAFLDQRENYAAAEKYARGEALDVFTYQGGFALHLARSCDKVTGVDSSRPALEAADQNAALNDREIEWIEANAFDLLRDYSDSGRKYDTIVLDPPAFAKSRQNRETAIRGYKELNLRALKMLRPGGILVTCSCSYHVSAGDLLEVLSSAALDSHRNLRILENRGQAKDHPSVLGVPETAYLKCLISVVS
jgi:23S rRNA (cytosine1962-C5)-methyltransferase